MLGEASAATLDFAGLLNSVGYAGSAVAVDRRLIAHLAAHLATTRKDT